MHELSVCQSLVQVVQEHLPSPATKVLSVTIQVGRLSCVLPEAMQFAFDAIIQQTPLAGAKLQIERVPASVQCQACGRTSEIEPPIFACGHCRSSEVEMMTGRELNLSAIEIDEPETPERQAGA